MIESEQVRPTRGSRFTAAPPVIRQITTSGGNEGEDGDMSAIWWAQGMNEDQVAASLRATIDSA